ncbi:hypothetical protein [Motilimonas eburnea]|uniref:hypothetical protein n=1 Tax=Motilimonas eburnea TaxID=1737488 RepID=UPI001E294EBF|nr:hypothetical protein [Motilimonas eburnea]MCE2571690.1 hypothetical protein [Motilimonas eburnea]
MSNANPQEGLMLIEVIKGLSLIIAAAIPSLVAALISRSRTDLKQLKAKYRRLLSDHRFMLELEQNYVQREKDLRGQSGKNTMRKQVLQTTNLTLSGRFTPNRIDRELGKEADHE